MNQLPSFAKPKDGSRARLRATLPPQKPTPITRKAPTLPPSTSLPRHTDGQTEALTPLVEPPVARKSIVRFGQETPLSGDFDAKDRPVASFLRPVGLARSHSRQKPTSQSSGTRNPKPRASLLPEATLPARSALTCTNSKVMSSSRSRLSAVGGRSPPTTTPHPSTGPRKHIKGPSSSPQATRKMIVRRTNTANQCSKTPPKPLRAPVLAPVRISQEPAIDNNPILDRTWEEVVRGTQSPRCNGTFLIAPNSARDSSERRTPTLGDGDQSPEPEPEPDPVEHSMSELLDVNRAESATPLLRPSSESRLSVAEALACLPVVPEQAFATPAAPRLPVQSERFFTPMQPPSAALVAKGRLSLGPSQPESVVSLVDQENTRPRQIDIPSTGATCFVLSRSAKPRGSTKECFSVSRRSRRSLSRHGLRSNGILSVAQSPRALVEQLQTDPTLRELVGGHEVIIPDALAHQALQGASGIRSTKKRGRTIIQVQSELDLRALEAEFVTSYSPVPLKITDQHMCEEANVGSGESDEGTFRPPGLGRRGVGHRQESEAGVFISGDDTKCAFPLKEVSSRTPTAGASHTCAVEHGDTREAGGGSVVSWMRYDDVSPTDWQALPQTEPVSTSAGEGLPGSSTPLLVSKRLDSLPVCRPQTALQHGCQKGIRHSKTPPATSALRRGQTVVEVQSGQETSKSTSPNRRTSLDDEAPDTSFMLKRLAQHSRQTRGATPLARRDTHGTPLEGLRRSMAVPRASMHNSETNGASNTRPPLSSRKSLASLRQ